ncbi:MAG: amino acid permease, partial [Methanobacterium sp.]
MLGAGIYALLGDAASLAGNAIWLSFIIASIVAAFTALSYAELSSIFSSSAAEYEYVKNAMGKRIGF